MIRRHRALCSTLLALVGSAAVLPAIALNSASAASAATAPRTVAVTATATVAHSSPTTGCVPSQTTLHLAYLTAGAAAVQVATGEMEAKYPGLQIDGSPSTATSYDALSDQIIADRAAGQPDNVVVVGLDQVHFFVRTFRPERLLLSELRPTYDRSYLPLGEVNGVPYVAPFQVSVPTLYVNETLTEKAGVTTLPQTTAQLIADGEKVKSALGIAPIDFSPDSIPDWYSQGLLQSGGVPYVNASGDAGFDNSKGMKVLSFYQQLGSNGLEDPVSDSQALGAFLGGSLPYIVSSSALAETVVKDVGSKFNWMPVAMPIPAGGKASYPAGGNGWMVLLRDRCTVAFGNEFIGDLLSPQTIAQSSLAYSYLPVDKQAREQVLAEDTNSPQLTYVESYKFNLTPWSGFPGTTTNQIDPLVETMVEQIVDGTSPSQVVPSTVHQINQIVG